MANCKDCVHYELCRRIDYELEYHNKSIKEAEEELPIKCRFFKNKTDVVPVVRCKDCKHYKTDSYYCQKTKQGYCELDDTVKQKQGYCSYGERRYLNE